MSMYLSKVVLHCRSTHAPQLLRNVPHSWNISRSIDTKTTAVQRPNKRPRIVASRRGKLPTFMKTASAENDKNNAMKQETLKTDVPPYAEIDPKNSQFVKLMTSVKTRKQRYCNKIIMLEGKRLIKEALVADVEPIMIVFNRKHLIKDLDFDPSYTQFGTTIFHYLSYRHVKTWSELKNSPGIFGLFRMPNLERNRSTISPLPITLVCDNIRDPSNLGAILRVAAAIPVENVFLLSGCTDLWDTKVTRSSCGAMFHLKIHNNASWEDVEDNCSGNVILADHEADDDYRTLDEITEDGIIQAEQYVEYSEDDAIVNDDDDGDDDETVDMRTVYNLPLKPYYGIDYTNNNSYVIVIGGETQGLSENSFKYASARNGVRVNIPLAATVNSLNSATAFGIISFEIKRQLQE